jgi:CheY-like chemotaxis protein
MSDDIASHHCCVLIVEDDEDVRELLRVALRAEGYRVACVANGREALNHLRSHADTCMILLDLMLPVMDATDFRTAQLQDRSLAWIPVILMTGAEDSERRGRELNVRWLVRKPLDVDKVKQALASVACRLARPRRAGTAAPPP